MVVLQGRVLDRRCRGVAGATIDVWYGAREDQHGENHYRGIKTSFYPSHLLLCPDVCQVTRTTPLDQGMQTVCLIM